MAGHHAVQPLILIVDGKVGAASFLASTLASHGFRTLHASNRSGPQLQPAARDARVVLLDLVSCDLHPVSLTARLRDWTSAPLLAILPRSREPEKEVILDAGANDYIVAPFGPDELLARLRIWLRHKARNHASQAVGTNTTSARLRIDRVRRSVYIEGRRIHMTPLECTLLVMLAHDPGRSVPEEHLLTAEWGSEGPKSVRGLRLCVRQLRRKIEDDPRRPRYLVASGDGYRLAVS